MTAPIILGPLFGFALVPSLIGLKPAIENDKKRDKIFEEALNTCLSPNTKRPIGFASQVGVIARGRTMPRPEALYRSALAIETLLASK